MKRQGLSAKDRKEISKIFWRLRRRIEGECDDNLLLMAMYMWAKSNAVNKARLEERK